MRLGADIYRSKRAAQRVASDLNNDKGFLPRRVKVAKCTAYKLVYGERVRTKRVRVKRS